MFDGQVEARAEDDDEADAEAEAAEEAEDEARGQILEGGCKHEQMPIAKGQRPMLQT